MHTNFVMGYHAKIFFQNEKNYVNEKQVDTQIKFTFVSTDNADSLCSVEEFMYF